MRRLRPGAFLAGVLASLAVVTASAQSPPATIPNGVFVREPSGVAWLVLGGRRVAVPVWRASDEDVAAIPDGGRYAVMNDAGAIVAGDRPAWLAEASAPGPSPSPVAAPPVGSLSDFSGGWWRHGFVLSVNEDGSAQASWRIYRRCGDAGVSGPCDLIQGDATTDGGQARLTFTAVEVPTVARDWTPEALANRARTFEDVRLPIARGIVVSSTDESRLRPGPIALVLLPHDTGALVQDGDGVLICRPSVVDGVPVDSLTPAQREAKDHRACGA